MTLPTSISTGSGDDRRQAGQHRMFRSERQEHFRKATRKEVLLTGRRQKDTERRRMEEYRRLCKQEGIQSARLAEYDAQITTAKEDLDKALALVDADISMSGTEKRKRRFALKRKIASTPITELVKQKKGIAQAIARAEKTSAAQRMTKEEAETARSHEKEFRVAARRQQQFLLRQRTRHGQPLMQSRVENLLNKIQRQR
jgi:hypothetical protein